jgi:hypothetical protein
MMAMVQRKTLTRDSLRTTRASPCIVQALRIVRNPTRIGAGKCTSDRRAFVAIGATKNHILRCTDRATRGPKMTTRTPIRRQSFF